MMMMQYSAVILLFVVLLQCSSALDLDGSVHLPSLLPVPDQPAQQAHHHLSKRQSSCLFFFLDEPPRSLQCLPLQGSLSLDCKFLVGLISTRQTVDIGWFFSLNGVVADLVQADRFQATNTFVAFESDLVVLNPLPGAYFCSVAVSGQIFDSDVLRVDNQTLQTVCLPGQSPLLVQPSTPRCATRGVPINRNTLSLRTVLSVTNTINFGGGVENPTPTYNVDLLRTMNIPEDIETPIPFVATPTAEPGPGTTDIPIATPVAEPVPQQSFVGIGVGVAIAALVVLAALVLAVILGAIFCVKRRERNQFPTKRKKKTNLFERFTLRLNVEPLLAHPPDRPPPVLNKQHEEIEMVYTVVPNNNPQPYEQAARSMPRYTGGPVIEARQATKKRDDSFAVRSQSVPSPLGKQESYYSRPKFFKSGRNFSTSTHTYGELGTGIENTTDSSMYISPNRLEPFIPSPSEHQVTENELMLGKIEESTVSNTSTDFLPSGSEEGSLSDEFGEYPEGEEEEEEEEEESNEYSLDVPSSWVDKSPATGQDNPLEESQEPEYINTRHPPQEIVVVAYNQDDVKYVNARATAAMVAESTKISIKSAPSGSGIKKRKKKIKRNKSTPASPRKNQDEEEEYTGLTLETTNYTSVYASTIRRPALPGHKEED